MIDEYPAPTVPAKVFPGSNGVDAAAYRCADDTDDALPPAESKESRWSAL